MTAFSNRRVSLLVVLAGVLLVGLAAMASVRRTTISIPLDANSPAPNGALGLRLWLQHQGHAVTVPGNGAPDFSSLPPNASVFMLEQGVDLATGDAAALAFARRGGTIAIASDGTYNTGFLHRLGIQAAPARGSDPTVVEPLLLSPPVAHLGGAISATLEVGNRAVAVAAVRGHVALAVWRVGRGTIWFLGTAPLLENRYIERADNWRLALNLAGSGDSPVVFDQYVPTAPGSITDWLTESTWGVAVLFVLLVCLLYRWLAGRRLGPAVIPLSDHHRAGSEYVQSMAGLLQRAGARKEVLKQYQSSLDRLDDRRDRLTADQRDTLERLRGSGDRPSESELVQRAAEIVKLEEEVARSGR